jgi:hypothetical protein
MKRSMVCALVLGALAAAACKKSNDTSAQEAPKTQETKTPAAKDTAKAEGTADIGVQAGGIQHADSEGSAAMIASVKGTVEVRRVGETQWAGAKQDMKLYAGDMVRTGDEASATITMADQSTVEMAETSSMAIASRDGTADPASSAAMLGGMARFTVTPRAPGEGAFRVYTSSGVILTKGTTYGVGVSASGEARVGVESGSVDVIGLAQMDATPIAVEKTTQVVIAADGSVGSPAPWPTDDWGTWRDETDAKIQLTAAMDAHANAMADLNKQLVEGYAQLQTTADANATFEATAATAAEKNDQAAYTAALPEGSPRGADVGIRIARRARDGALGSPPEGSRGELDRRRSARRCSGPLAEALRDHGRRVLRTAAHAVLRAPSAGSHAREARRHRGARVLRRGSAAGSRSGCGSREGEARILDGAAAQLPGVCAPGVDLDARCLVARERQGDACSRARKSRVVRAPADDEGEVARRCEHHRQLAEQAGRGAAAADGGPPRDVEGARRHEDQDRGA